MTIPTFQTSINTILYCQRSGVPIAKLDLITTAGTLPYIALWKDGVCYHPLFAMDFSRLLAHTREEWMKLGQRATDSELSTREEESLQLCFLALLHTVSDLRQDVPGLPKIQVVLASMEKLIELAGWKFFLESKSFRFPDFHVSKLNKNTDFWNIGAYLETCEEVRESWSEKINELEEQEKIRAAERAMDALRSEWVTPISKKLLWSWVRSNLPKENAPDAQGWLGTIFLGTENTVLQFEKEDVELFEEIILSACPVGNSIYRAVKDRVQKLVAAWKQHFEAWDLELTDDNLRDPILQLLVNGQRQKTPHPGDEPKFQDFASRGAYIQTHARWKIAMAHWNKENQA